jgi:hypothetical protein
MKTKTKVIIILITAVALAFYGIALYKDFLSRCQYFNRSLAGRVTDIRLDEKKLAEIKLNENELWIYLGTNISYQISINKGDSIYKKSRDYEAILVKDGKSYNISSKRVIAKYFKYCRCDKE